MQERGIDIRRLSPEAIDNIMSRYEERIEQQAARIKELEAEVEAKNKQIKELQDIIDKPPEEAQWMTDYHLLRSAMDGTIIESARRWHGAFRKAQNSNLIRLQQNARLGAEVERLRSLNESLMENGNDLRTRCQKAEARIKELEATKERLQSAPKFGLYGKYIIQKADGSPVDPEADYFILRLDADPVARIAALEYAIQTDDQKLGEMLEKRVMDHVFSKDDQCRKRVEGWPIGQIKQLREQIASKDARIKELEAENERLEAAFLRSNAAMRYYQEGNRGPWPQLGEKFKEPYQEKAREALERIKEGRKDE